MFLFNSELIQRYTFNRRKDRYPTAMRENSKQPEGKNVLKKKKDWVLVAHTCNPSYLGG
jgi:hypothetical protein